MKAKSDKRKGQKKANSSIETEGLFWAKIKYFGDIALPFRAKINEMAKREKLQKLCFAGLVHSIGLEYLPCWCDEELSDQGRFGS